ncbi:MAG: hypothetical protein PHW34_07750 [Hespellia sp.]|nr:hypothetical protein [Hespellia sp.]
MTDRAVVINEKNVNNIEQLYGRCTADELERIVNNHIAVAVEEIFEDMNK